MRRQAILAVALTAASLAAPGCGLPSGPVEVRPEDLPFTLGSPQPPGSPEEEVLRVYFVRAGRLVEVSRKLSSDETPSETAMRLLLKGPASDERGAGISSKIPVGTELLEVQVFDRIAQVDVSAEFEAPARPQSVLLRLAQVVWTLVALPDITAVRFVVDGEPIAVTTDRGTVVERPVTAPDYGTVAPPG
jgi:spore germination protein GerM